MNAIFKFILQIKILWCECTCVMRFARVKGNVVSGNSYMTCDVSSNHLVSIHLHVNQFILLHPFYTYMKHSTIYHNVLSYLQRICMLEKFHSFMKSMIVFIWRSHSNNNYYGNNHYILRLYNLETFHIQYGWQLSR